MSLFTLNKSDEKGNWGNSFTLFLLLMIEIKTKLFCSFEKEVQISSLTFWGLDLGRNFFARCG